MDLCIYVSIHGRDSSALDGPVHPKIPSINPGYFIILRLQLSYNSIANLL